jgi:hypothetical protein
MQMGSRVIEVSGRLDREVIARLQQQLTELPGDAEVVLDVRRCEIPQDTVLAALGRALPQGGHGVRVLGLNSHQHRLLQYLGFLAAEPPRQALA